MNRPIILSIILTILLFNSPTASGRNGSISELLNLPLDSFAVVAVSTDMTPIIDGELDDSCWAICSPYGNFTQVQPNQESAASESTLCYFAYDSENIYFAARCYDSEPDKVIANVKRREDIAGEDVIELCLDTYNEQRSAYTFDLNPLGVQGDGIKVINGSDDSWDGVWASCGKKKDFGWQVEAAIPFKTLRFPDKKEQIWGVQVIRVIQRKSEFDSYIPYRKFDTNDLERMAPLVGINSIRQSLLLNVLPYLTNNYSKYSGIKDSEKVNFGADMKCGLGSSLVIDATINPDFSQVEADVDQINLTPYRLYLQEKRPFFLERADIFATPFYLFYSRRIENPDFGIRSIGKEGKYGFGVLFAQDNNLLTNHKDDYLVARCERQVAKQSAVGLMTTYSRSLERYNATAAVDWKLLSGPMRLEGQIARSDTREFRNLAWKGWTELTYYRNNMAFWYSHSLYERNFFADAGFIYPLVVDLNNSAFSYRTDQLGANYNWFTNGKYFQKISPYASFYIQHNYDGTMIARAVDPSLTITFQNNIGFTVSYRFERSLWENRYFNKYAAGLSFSANPGGHFGVSAFYQEGKDLDYWNVVSVWQRNLSLGIAWNIGERLELIPSAEHVSQYKFQHGPRTYNQWNGLLRIGYHFTKNVFMKAFLQSNSYYETYLANFLLGYTFLPGSTFYLAYNSNYSGKYLMSRSRFLFAKLSYLIGR